MWGILLQDKIPHISKRTWGRLPWLPLSPPKAARVHFGPPMTVAGHPRPVSVPHHPFFLPSTPSRSRSAHRGPHTFPSDSGTDPVGGNAAQCTVFEPSPPGPLSSQAGQRRQGHYAWRRSSLTLLFPGLQHVNLPDDDGPKTVGTSLMDYFTFCACI